MKRIFGLSSILLFGSIAFGQGNTSSQPEITSTKIILIIEEPPPFDINLLKYRIDYLFIALNADLKKRGLIVNFGTNKTIAKRKAEIIRAIKFRGYDLNRVKFLKRFSKRKIKTELYAIDGDGKSSRIPYPKQEKVSK